jgi:thiaminase
MDKIILEKIKKDKLTDYLKQNSYYIKDLNRNPNYYETFKKIIKEKYNLKITNKVSNIIEDIELVSSIISSIN